MTAAIADYFQLSSLLTGPTTNIEHDEANDGSFKDLASSISIQMLTYFSTTIRDEYYHQSSETHLEPCNCSRCWYRSNGGHRRDCSDSMYLLPNTPTSIRLVGGDATSHLDLIHWMTSCCSQNALLPLSSIIASPTRFILAMTSVRILDVALLEREIPQLVQKLENEMLDIETVGKIFASGENVLSEVRDAICTCVAGFFFAGRLHQVDRWMHLGKMNRRFDDGVWKVLDITGDRVKLETWERKDVQRYPAEPIAGFEQGRHQWGPDVHPSAFPRLSTIRDWYADQIYGARPAVHPQLQPPRPPCMSCFFLSEPPRHAAYNQPVRPTVSENYLAYQPHSNRHLSWRTSSSSSSTSDSPLPRPPGVHFDDARRTHRTLALPPTAPTPYYPTANVWSAIAA